MKHRQRCRIKIGVGLALFGAALGAASGLNAEVDIYGNPIYSTAAGDAYDYQFLVAGQTQDTLSAVGSSAVSSNDDAGLDAIFNSSLESNEGSLWSTPWRGLCIIIK